MTSLPPSFERPALRAQSVFAYVATLAILIAALFAIRPDHIGDVGEYALMTIAISNHASPDIRPDDVAAARELLPQFAPWLDALRHGMQENAQVPMPGFYRGFDGRTYAIHFFAYPALAALPLKMLGWVGAPPLKCFEVVNLALVFVLGLALLRLFGARARATLAVLMFLLCGGLSYVSWSSPECMSAAALLAGLILFATNAPVAGGLLAGLAAMQNPPIVFFCVFAPLLRLCLEYRRGAGIKASMARVLQPRDLLGIGLAAAMFALPLLFNLWAFGMPSVIAKFSTSAELASLNRLHSFFFDLNQGMIVGVPGLLGALVLCGWSAQPRTVRLRALALIAAASAFAVALALPTLVTQNWNSAAAGMMRYASWAAMPLLFAFLWRLRVREHWPVAMVLAVLLAQLAGTAYGRRSKALELNALSQRVFERVPGAYNPDPEIFYERLEHHESYVDYAGVYAFRVDGVALKTLFNLRNRNAVAELCGPDRVLSPANHYVDADMQWRYINGPVQCAPMEK